jgi:hypothetical protein
MDFTTDSDIIAAPGEMSRRDFIKKTAPAVVAPSLLQNLDPSQILNAAPIAQNTVPGLLGGSLEAVAKVIGNFREAAIPEFANVSYAFGRFAEIGGRYGLHLKTSDEVFGEGGSSWFVLGDDGKLKELATAGGLFSPRDYLEDVPLKDLPNTLVDWFYREAEIGLQPMYIHDDEESKKPKGPSVLRKLKEIWKTDPQALNYHVPEDPIKVSFQKFIPDSGKVMSESYREHQIYRSKGSEEMRWSEDQLKNMTPEQRQEIIDKENDVLNKEMEAHQERNRIRQKEYDERSSRNKMNQHQDERPSYNQTHGPFDWEPGDESKWASKMTESYTVL